MATQDGTLERGRIDLALEAAIHIGLAFLLATACLWILRPFAPLLTWGVIMAVFKPNPVANFGGTIFDSSKFLAATFLEFRGAA